MIGLTEENCGGWETFVFGVSTKTAVGQGDYQMKMLPVFYTKAFWGMLALSFPPN